MAYKIYKANLRSRYLVYAIIVLDLDNYACWVVHYISENAFLYSRLLLQYYDGDSNCMDIKYPQLCFAQTNECNIAFLIVNLFYYSFMILFWFQMYVTAISILTCCCEVDWLIKLNYNLKIVVFLIAAVIFFYTTSYVMELQRATVNVNESINSICIAKGVLCTLSSLAQTIMNYDLYCKKDIDKIKELKQKQKYNNTRTTTTEPIDSNQIQVIEIRYQPQNQQYGQQRISYQRNNQRA